MSINCLQKNSLTMKSRPCMCLETMAFLRFQINCNIKRAYQKAILQLSEHEAEVDLVFIQTFSLFLWKLRFKAGFRWRQSRSRSDLVKIKNRVVGGIINAMEWESDESERFRFLPTPLRTPSFTI